MADVLSYFVFVQYRCRHSIGPDELLEFLINGVLGSDGRLLVHCFLSES